jgi:predicted PurR-regulated permease PerM
VGAERVVTFRPRTILTVVGVLLAVAVALLVVWTARRALTWALVALFLALAMNPAVESLRRRGIRRRGIAAAVVYVVVLLCFATVAALFVPPVVKQITDLVDALPGYVHDLTAGRGPLGFLETRYHVVERTRDAIGQGNATGILGGAGTALSITRGVVTGVAAVVTIAFMAFFMLLEGPAWVERGYGLLPAQSQARWRKVGYDIYRTVGGYVSGNLLISLIAGTTSTFVLLALGVPFAVALGLVVAILDLIPLAGATLAAVLVTAVALTHSTSAAVVMVVFFVVYQQLENHLLQPIVYGRTVNLSPLAVLISVLVGAEIAGVLGALMAIPIAGTLQVLLVDWQDHRATHPDGIVLPEEEADAHRTAISTSER